MPGSLAKGNQYGQTFTEAAVTATPVLGKRFVQSSGLPINRPQRVVESGCIRLLRDSFFIFADRRRNKALLPEHFGAQLKHPIRVGSGFRQLIK